MAWGGGLGAGGWGGDRSCGLTLSNDGRLFKLPCPTTAKVATGSFSRSAEKWQKPIYNKQQDFMENKNRQVQTLTNSSPNYMLLFNSVFLF